MRRPLSVVTLLVLLFAPLAAGAKTGKTDSQEARAYIDELAQNALTILQDDGSSLADREAAVRDLIEDNLDMDTIGRFVMGRHWRNADKEQQEEYLGLFREFVLQTYARRLGGYSGQTFKVVDAREIGKRGDVLVNTEIIEEGAPPIVAGWRVSTREGRMVILDVMVEGVSMAATQRSEFDAIVRRDGVDGLIEVLRVKVTKLAAQS